MKSMNEEQFKAILGLYSKKGYRIIKEPKAKNEMPPFLNSLNYYPDYIIRSEGINYIVELSSSKNFNTEQRLKKIIEDVEKNTTWEFILVEVDIKSKDEGPAPPVKSKEGKAVPEIKPKADKPVRKIEQKEDKKSPGSEQEEEKPGRHIKAKEVKPVPDTKQKEDKPVRDIEQKEEKKTSDLEPEDEKPDTKFEPITKGYSNLKLMLENKQLESNPGPVLLYGWVLLESMIRKLAEKEQAGTDIGFLLNEAVSVDIISKLEISGLKNVYLLRNKMAGGELGIVTDKLQLEPLIKVIDKLYGNYFS